MKFFFIIFCFFIFQLTFVQAQKVDIFNELLIKSYKQGQVTIHQDNTIEKIVNEHIRQNKQQDGIAGYRINIFFDSGFDRNGIDARTRAIAAKDTFDVYHYTIPSYLKFETPNYKVYVGDFRTKTDALKVFKDLKKEYPKAFIVNDKINYFKF